MLVALVYIIAGILFLIGFRTTISAIGGNLQGHPGALRNGLIFLGLAGAFVVLVSIVDGL